MPPHCERGLLLHRLQNILVPFFRDLARTLTRWALHKPKGSGSYANSTRFEAAL